jgi:hypothetical protein
MFTLPFIVLALLFVKHWYIDFVNQTSEEVAHKGIYLDWLGVKHSLKQGVATFLILMPFAPIVIAIGLGLLDFLIHYHTDYSKMRWGNRDIQSPQFWNHLGLDQLVHSLTYVFIIWFLVA